MIQYKFVLRFGYLCCTVVLSTVFFLGSSSVAHGAPQTMSTKEQQVLIQELLLQVKELQEQLKTIQAVKDSVVEVEVRPSIKIVNPRNNQSVQARKITTDTILWDYNAFPKTAGDLVVRERYFDRGTGAWSRWFTLLRLDDYHDQNSVAWTPAQLYDETTAQVWVGLLTRDEKQWLAYDVVSFNLFPY